MQRIVEREGSLEFNVFKSRDELSSRLDFRDSFPSFDDFLVKADLMGKYPIYYLEHITIDVGLRDQGLGTKLLTRFELEACCNNAMLLMLKLGWPGADDWKLEKEKNEYFYKKVGYTLVQLDCDGPIFGFKKCSF